MHLIVDNRLGGRVNHFLVAAMLTFLAQTVALGQEKIAAGARCEGVDGALLMQGKPGNWQPIAAKGGVPAECLFVALFGAELHSGNNAVEIRLAGDVGERGNFPVMEAAARLHENPEVDADLTLERGIVILSNRKKAGAAKVQVRMGPAKLHITLPDAKSRLGIEIYGRHVPGPAHLDDPKKDTPVMHVFFLALEGEPTIANDARTVQLKAPPGDALVHWDSATRTVETRFLNELPELAKPLTGDQRKKFQALCGYAHLLTEKSGTLGQHLDALAQDARQAESRKVAVTAMGALDDLTRLVAALDNARYADTRDHAVMVFRQWLGRAPGQSIKLYEHLTKVQGYSPIQAKLFLHLCNGIVAEKLRQPGTYEFLIQTLDHKKLPLRELARWHLDRLVPEGKTIAYDAGADETQRRQAIAAWRRLIPEGELPRAPKQ